ncbi:MAG TPA: pyridoxamine 5'-phosphate oxidase [Polyangiaceae bacterium]
MQDDGHGPVGAKLAALRQEYARAGLSPENLASTPIAQLEVWFAEAMAAGAEEANAVTLATVSPDGTPTARIVLVKGIDPRGLVFYTNYDSPKGRDLAANPHAALVVFWRELERQVRVTGLVEKVTREESNDYFQSRPRGSQLGAWASHQSEVLPNRDPLDARLAELEARYATAPIPLPPFWGGYRLCPKRVEFWQGRPNRLHDRLEYVETDKGWTIRRLSP